MGKTSRPIVEMSDVHLTLTSRAGEVNILRGIDLTVDAGCSVAIVGPSGSGKTSLMMVVAGLESPSSGSVKIDSRDIARLSTTELATIRGTKIGIVFQSFHLVPTMTAIENIALPLELQGATNAFNTADQLLRDVGLRDRASHFPAELSGGEQQRIAIARALSTRPKLVLADEPTGNLDAKTGAQISDLLFELHESHETTLMLITHDESLAARCQNVHHMLDGKIVNDAPTPLRALKSLEQ